MLSHDLLVVRSGLFVEDVHGDTGGDGGEPGAVGRVHGPAVGVVGVLDEALLARARDVDPRAVHRQPLGHDALGEVVPPVRLRGVAAAHAHLVHLLGAEGVGREAERYAGTLLDQGGAQPPVPVVRGYGVRQGALALIESEQVRHERRPEVGPELLLGQEPFRAAGDAQYPDVRGVRVGVRFRGELGPFGVVDAAGEDVCHMAHLAEDAGHLSDVDELAAEVRVGGQVAVARVEVALRVQEGYAHQAGLIFPGIPRPFRRLSGWRRSRRGRCPRGGGPWS